MRREDIFLALFTKSAMEHGTNGTHPDVLERLWSQAGTAFAFLEEKRQRDDRDDPPPARARMDGR